MSGRDVRRLAARATNMTHEAKRDLVARAAAGLDAVGVEDIYVMREPFRIAAAALEHMALNARVHVLEQKLKNDASDTESAVRRFLSEGCRTLISLGGDGTNRAIMRTLVSCARARDVTLIPLSTGTNNVFPVMSEPTVAGVVAGLAALGMLDDATRLRTRAKLLHVRKGGEMDVGVIDAVLLRDDHVGNLLPFDPQRISRILLTRALPGAIGMSPIGGLIEVVEHRDDEGLLVELGEGLCVRAPVSPGLFREVSVRSVSRVPFEVAVPFQGPGVLALDGDRDHKLREGEHATVTMRRDGPWLYDIDAVMRWAVAAGMMAAPEPKDRQ
ncbi:MAG: NAD(+)/NADH kinase [Pseudomonadales bacterium]|nr:NAD(+)/NADH kinase [Pseudomonadales bacterium]